MIKRRLPSLNYPNTFRVDLLHSIQQYLLVNQQKQVQKVIDEIALLHRGLTKTLAGFRYKGKCYQHHLVNEFFFKFAPLHISLVDRFKEYLTVWALQAERQATLDMVLVNTLNDMGNVNDLYQILPECIHCVLPECDGKEPTLTQEYIDFFKQSNQTELGLIPIQLVMKTLKG